MKLGEHRTVLLHEAIDALSVDPAGIYVDATFGRGGHSQLLLSRLGPTGRLIGFDKDQAAIAAADALFGDEPRFSMVHGSFAEIAEQIRQRGLERKISGILLDLGVSSPQLDQAQRGFSFMQDGPLDMRMDQSRGISAADWLNQAEEDEMTRVFKEYGEERFARRIARAIVQQRLTLRLSSTAELAALIERAVPVRDKHKHPATRTFQAIRIYINRELDDLMDCLAAALQVMDKGARLVVISFHSLEDRIVKRFMREQERGPQLPKRLPVMHAQTQGKLRVIGKPIKPSEQEVADNPRARSAVMRVAEVLG